MPSFDPFPLLSNPHVQTVLGTFLPSVLRLPRATKRIVPLADGDAVVLHETPGPNDRCPLALLLHGLGGSHRSAYLERMTHHLSARGWRVARMDLRGAGAGIRLTRRFYNAACSADVRAAVAQLTHAYPEAPIAVVGFSLGGNIALKYAGELGADDPGMVRAVAALAPPIDLLRCSDLIARYKFYDAFFVRLLTSQVARHERYFPDVPRVVFPRGLNLRGFDDLYTAPRWGYADALDYYRKASAFPWISAIRVPTFILAARDDPFVAVAPFEAITAAPQVEVHISAHGGHMGFLGIDGAGGIRWAETQLLRWLTRMPV